MLTMTPGMLGKTGFSLEHELEVRHQSATYAAAPSLSASGSLAFQTTMSRSRSESEPGIIPVVTPVISHGHVAIRFGVAAARGLDRFCKFDLRLA